MPLSLRRFRIAPATLILLRSASLIGIDAAATPSQLLGARRTGSSSRRSIARSGRGTVSPSSRRDLARSVGVAGAPGKRRGRKESWIGADVGGRRIAGVIDVPHDLVQPEPGFLKRVQDL